MLTGQSSLTLATSKVNITNILFKNIHGVSSGKEGIDVASLVCSPAAVCENIRLEDIDLRSPENLDEQGVVLCDGIAGGVGVPCVANSATEA
jgi:galacturan 1,4-alpha-galacturonidase